MKVDYCLILAAGFGTRMGELGKSLPKPLWPVFNRRMLGMQIDMAKKYGANRVFVNTHFHSEKIKAYIEEYHPDVTILFEEEILGSGGAIHNLAQRDDVGYAGNLLIVNSDQFYFYEDELKVDFFSDKPFSVRLLGLPVKRGDSYNGLILKNEKLVGINSPESFKNDYITYSGVSLINLASLEPVSGNTSFFDTVANYKKLDVEVYTPKFFEYWDFGTLELYCDRIKEMTNKKNSKFLEFCKDKHVFENTNQFMKINEKGGIELSINGEWFQL